LKIVFSDDSHLTGSCPEGVLWHRPRRGYLHVDSAWEQKKLEASPSPNTTCVY